ncbi:MAG: histidine triad nucleotide-binding protein [Thermodesulfobacteriota bacterium]|jgi:histidine triad (HIT) family protein|nr:histidine triad nucleotide-binding protein [bacterium]MBT3850480.1 histidine triad nucleotide-binding protein [bacterium]MDG2446122.1 histidine triad nucleotide-binding protein [Thermodesulfobacteriota bacterium]RZP12533.1 MAG: histidine triad nucleotide-binding protein [Candidatus Dadabacteria bacterium]|tara:strand:+ start:1885 stop:2226 length:342 start_codon:yes stop_codon:yes gene_type:complete
MNDTIFGKILRKEIPTDIIYEDDLSIAFNDINPQAPIHILIIPKKLIAMPEDIDDEDIKIVGNLFVVASKIAKDLNIDKGYRLVMNNGSNAGQSVFHIHLHMLSGRKLSWPPG